MKKVERPSPILVAALNHGIDGLADSTVRFDSCLSQIIEATQDIVMPKRGNEKRSQRLSMTSPVRSERNMRRLIR
jgi:hypothetical protein